MPFSTIIGQKNTKEQLTQLVQQNRLSHALLFLGKEGSGALPLAIAFAQYVNCEKVNGKKPTTAEPSLFGQPEPPTTNHQPPPSNDSCGTCPSCIKAQQLIHPDIHFSYPVIPAKPGDKPLSTEYINEWREFIKTNPYGNSYDWLQFINAENKQGNITAYECNDIIRKLSLKSFENGYKILIMWMPEALGKEGNKLLKLIEEPPAKTLFILVAENEDLILPTILSRLQLVKIPALSKLDVEAALAVKQGIAIEKAQQVAAVSDGNYREALQQLQHAEEDWNILLREWLNHIVKRNLPAQVKWVEDIAKIGREKQKQFLKYFTQLIEDAVYLRTTNHQSPTTNDFPQRLNKLTSLEQQQAIAEQLDEASYHIERNANAKILFHALTIRLHHIINNNSLILMN
jgi:DNA polymerase-3 subunit delta'